jgi:glycosyltransferase involved in cell wall biosynthesis
LPPPIHGASLTNDLVYNSAVINSSLKKRLLRINYNTDLSSINKFNLTKILKYIKLYFRFIYELLFFRPYLIYYTIPPTGKGLYKDILFVLTIKLFFVKPVYHLHGKGIYENTKNSKFKKFIHRWVYSNAVVIHLSDNLLSNEIKRLQTKKSELFVVNNGLPVQQLLINSTIKNKFINILFLSNITLSKGIIMSLKVLRELIKTHRNIRFNIIGDFRDDVTRKTVKNFIDSNKLKKYVTFFGALYGDEKFRLVSKMDFLLYPSFNDAYPLVLLEALQFGIPIVASNQGAIPEMINDEVGFVFKTGNLNEAVLHCNKIIQLILKDENTIKRKCTDLFAKKYTKDIFEKRMKAVIDLSMKKV